MLSEIDLVTIEGRADIGGWLFVGSGRGGTWDGRKASMNGSNFNGLRRYSGKLRL